MENAPMNDQVMLFTVMFAAVILLVVVVLMRLLRVWGKTRNEKRVDLTVKRSPSPKFQLRPGGLYFLRSPDLNAGAQALRGHISKDGTGLFVSRTFPRKAREKYHLGGTKCVWLSRETGRGGTNPTSLGPLLEELEEFLRENPGAMVLVGDLDYLVEENEFKRFLRFIKGLREVAESGAGRVLVTGSLKDLKVDERNAFLREVRKVGKGSGKVTKVAK